MPHTRLTLGLVVVVVVLTPRIAAAQTDKPPVFVSVGALGAIGFPAPLAAVRLGTIGPRAGIDVDLGRLSAGPGSDLFIAAQVRVLTKRRTSPGLRLAWFVGANHRETILTSQVRWPGGVVTMTQTRTSGIAGQIGVGADWLGRRSRVGLELATGGSESAGPRVFVKLYIAWSAPVGRHQ